MRAPAILALLLTACASQQKERDRTSAFLGKSAQELQKAWGRPHGAFVLNGNDVLLYHNGKPIGPDRCTHYFEVKDGKVIGVAFKGEGCGD